jgi:hypothetical protein
MNFSHGSYEVRDPANSSYERMNADYHLVPPICY